MKILLFALGALALLVPSLVAAETPSRGIVVIATDERAHLIHVEIADEPIEHSRGLMFRESLAVNSGMLFVYPSPRPAAFWMKNTMIPLDMLFIDADGRIVKIAEKTTPYSLKPVTSDAPVLGILEIAGGESARLGIAAGDIARWLEIPVLE